MENISDFYEDEDEEILNVSVLFEDLADIHFDVSNFEFEEDEDGDYIDDETGEYDELCDEMYETLEAVREYFPHLIDCGDFIPCDF